MWPAEPPPRGAYLATMFWVIVVLLEQHGQHDDLAVEHTNGRVTKNYVGECGYPTMSFVIWGMRS